jgi:hypothetical protein
LQRTGRSIRACDVGKTFERLRLKSRMEDLWT